jgi:integrase
MRRGEPLGLRWRDVDLDAATITVRRSAGLIQVAGQGKTVTEGPTKTGKPRVIDLDPATVAVLREHKRDRGGLNLILARDDQLVFGDINGQHRHPERFSHTWQQIVARAIGDGIEVPPIRLHDLRHGHATILLLAGVPVHVVSQRLGHASPVVTMTVYAHVLPASQREAANLFAQLIGKAA